MQFENVGLDEKGVIESTLGLEQNDDGTFTVQAKQTFSRKNDKVVEMKFTKNGMNALIGIWRAAVEFSEDRQ